MTLQDYTTEELRAELKCRSDLARAEKNKVKRCRMCKHWGEVEVDYFGNASGLSITITSCQLHNTKNDKYYRCHAPSQPACEHFEPIIND